KGLKRKLKFIFLPNGEVHVNLGDVGGFKTAGGAVYECSNWYKNKIINTSGIKTNSANSNSKNKSSSSQYAHLSDDVICDRSVLKGEWETRDDYLPFVSEAKRRGLSCGVSFTDTSRKISSNNTIPITDEAICNMATDRGSWRTVGFAKEYVLEAKLRGLTCGIESEKEKNKRLALEKAKQEKERQAALEREKRLKAEQEKIKKKAEEVARKKRLKEEKVRKTKLAEEKARKKKLAEQERKRKLAQEELNTKIKDYKRKANNFYKDIENFVKSGGNVDLVKLSDFFDIKPNPKSKWNKSDLSRYEELRNFMVSIPQFVSFEKDRIGKRLKNSFAIKDQSIEELEKNLSELKGLMRKMFGSSEIPKIKQMVKDIQSTLSNFKQSTANKVLKQSSTYIASKFPKPKIQKKTVGVTTDDWKKYKSQTTPQQQQFCTLTKRFFKDLQKAKISRNEIMVNMVHKERQENLDALIPQGNINNWIFKVIKIDQVQDGSAAVILSLPCKSFIGSGQVHTKNTWTKKSEKEWRATIPYNDRRFRELAKLAKGEFVLASGILLEIEAFKPGQIETFYASQQIGEHPLTKGLNLEGELFIADLSYIAALN
ncbi:hypothetical protein OA529_00510, partial [Alphaproteobacteria bacterium]|nr:hypothetical protein [Alphaproteobacteria bacterium]